MISVRAVAFDISATDDVTPLQTVSPTSTAGAAVSFEMIARLDAPADRYRNGGVLRTVVRGLVEG